MSNGYLGRGNCYHEQHEDLSPDVAVDETERDQVDVHGIQHQLDRHEDHHAVTSGQHTINTGAEQERTEKEELVDEHAQSFLANTTAPIKAASNSTDIASNGTRYCEKIESPTSALLKITGFSGSCSVPNSSMRP